MSNSVDPDEMAHDEQSHLDLHCLQKPCVIAYGSERVKLHASDNNSFHLTQLVCLTMKFYVPIMHITEYN